MIAAVQTWVREQTRFAGIARVFYELEALARRNVLPFAVLLVQKETLTRDGTRVAVEDIAFKRVYRRRLYVREIGFTLLIAHRDEVSAEGALSRVLAASANGVSDSLGNHVRLRAEGIKWIDEGSVPRKKTVAQIDMLAVGGVYRDEEVPLIRDVLVESEEV
jgi:hypothetical protein